MKYLDKTILNKVNINSKALSLLVVLFFLSALGLGGYLVSYDKGKIDADQFTISQALAFGSKPIMITLFLLSFICTILLNYVRGGEKNLLYLRYLLTFIPYAFIIVIIYVTADVNKSLHFKFAGTIFLTQLLFVFVVSYLFNQYLDEDCNLLIPLDFNIVLIICSFVLLLVFGIYNEDDSSEFRSIIFATSENLTVFLNLLPILYLGFI